MEPIKRTNSSDAFSSALNSTFKPTDIIKFILEFLFTNTVLITCVATLPLVLYASKGFFFRDKHKSGYLSYSETLPSLRWIPYIKIPLLDAILYLPNLRKHGIRVLDKIVSMHGPNSRANLGTWRFIGVSDPEIIKKLLNSTNPAHLNKSNFFYDRLFTRLMKDGLVVSKFGVWSPHRKGLSPAFTYKSFPIYLKFILHSAKVIIDHACRIADSDENNGALDNSTMMELIDHHSVKIAKDIIMGPESCDFSDEQTTMLHSNIRTWKKTSTERFLRLELYFPPLWWISPLKKLFDSAIDNVTQLSCQIADKYRKKKYSLANKGEQHAVMETGRKQMLEKPYECLMEKMIKSGFSNKEIGDEVATFLIAGHETVKVALEFLIFHLAANPFHQKMCRMEVHELFNTKKSNKGKEDFSFNDFSQLKYLDRCISESLRITPPLPIILRDLNEPLEVKENLAFLAGETVYMMIWSLHRNEKIYPNPEMFDPDRFLRENVKQRHPYAYLPFSMGARNCIGWKVALLEIKVIMTWILRHFELVTTDSFKDVKILFDITLKTERPYNVNFKRIIKDNL